MRTVIRKGAIVTADLLFEANLPIESVAVEAAETAE